MHVRWHVILIRSLSLVYLTAIQLRCCVLVGQMKTALLEIRGRTASRRPMCGYQTLLTSAQKSIVQTESSSNARARPYSPSSNDNTPLMRMQRVRLPSHARLPDPRARAGDGSRAQAGRDRHRHRRGELHRVRRHLAHCEAAGELHRRHPHREIRSDNHCVPIAS